VVRGGGGGKEGFGFKGKEIVGKCRSVPWKKKIPQTHKWSIRKSQRKGTGDTQQGGKRMEGRVVMGTQLSN